MAKEWKSKDKGSKLTRGSGEEEEELTIVEEHPAGHGWFYMVQEFEEEDPAEPGTVPWLNCSNRGVYYDSEAAAQAAADKHMKGKGKHVRGSKR
jgi:hypothetical protein